MSFLSRIIRSLFHPPQPAAAGRSWETGPRMGRRAGRMAVDDCVAFLNGSLAEYRVEHGHEVVPWEWTNLLAHGDEAALQRELAADRRGFGPPDRRDPFATWRAARSYLVAELLGLAETCGPLDELQRALLVPLELELAERPQTAAWRPNEWLVAVERVLNAHRRRSLHVFPRQPHTPE